MDRRAVQVGAEGIVAEHLVDQPHDLLELIHPARMPRGRLGAHAILCARLFGVRPWMKH